MNEFFINSEEKILVKPHKTRNKKDITGNRYGRLVAVKSTSEKVNNSYKWECLCDCGKIVFVSVGSLNSGNTKSCGCAGIEQIIKHNKEVKRLPDNGGARNSLYSRYKLSARRKKLEFFLSKEVFNKLINQNCYYCGVQPEALHVQHKCSSRINYNGIDRVDSTLGYTIDNCVPCCKVCNTMKMSLPQDDFYRHIKKIYLYSIATYEGIEI